jgi:hypothetical protein
MEKEGEKLRGRSKKRLKRKLVAGHHRTIKKEIY